jgi:protease PrsW
MNGSTGLPYNPLAARRPPSARKGRGALTWLVGLTAALIALLLGLITLLLIGLSTGLVPMLIGAVVAVLPVPVYVMMALWLDRFEQEPRWLLAVAFLWGAMVAVGIAIIVNTLGISLVQSALGPEAADLYGLSISAPLVEEGAKALALLILFFWKRDEFDGVLDGIVYASMVGLGFAMTENIKYYAVAVMEGRTFGTFVVRGMFSPYAHPLFTSMTGIGLGIASHARSRAMRLAMPAVGFILAAVLHSIWNTSLFFSDRSDNGLVALAMYFVVMVPIFTGVLLVAFFGLLREGRILREHLACDVDGGRLARDEYERLCTVRGRLGSSLGTFFRRGPSAWRARRNYHAVASELAFHRHRVARGVVAQDAVAAEREAEYLHTFRELRSRMDV